MPEAYIAGVANRLGAIALSLSDGIREATEAATGMAGGLPAALVSLREWADGSSVDVLAQAMRVSHSRAVRVVDRLEAARTDCVEEMRKAIEDVDEHDLDVREVQVRGTRATATVQQGTDGPTTRMEFAREGNGWRALSVGAGGP